MNSFSHKRPVRDNTGAIIDHKPAPAFRITEGGLGGQHGADRGKRLIVGLEHGDLITFRPERTRRARSILAEDVYIYVLKCEAGLIAREKAAVKKQQRADRLAAKRLEAERKKLFKKVKS